jgi:hypothetical protein
VRTGAGAADVAADVRALDAAGAAEVCDAWPAAEVEDVADAWADVGLVVDVAALGRAGNCEVVEIV